MALADFIQSLQDQDIVYSDPPASSIRVIPPDNKGIKIIPPESIIKTPPKLKLNLRLQELDENSQAPVSVSTTAVTQPDCTANCASTAVCDTSTTYGSTTNCSTNSATSRNETFKTD